MALAQLSIAFWQVEYSLHRQGLTSNRDRDQPGTAGSLLDRMRVVAPLQCRRSIAPSCGLGRAPAVQTRSGGAQEQGTDCRTIGSRDRRGRRVSRVGIGTRGQGGRCEISFGDTWPWRLYRSAKAAARAWMEAVVAGDCDQAVSYLPPDATGSMCGSEGRERMTSAKTEKIDVDSGRPVECSVKMYGEFTLSL